MSEFNCNSTFSKFDSRKGYIYEGFMVKNLYDEYQYRKSCSREHIEYIMYLSETDIKNRFSKYITGIDHLVINYKEHKVFAIQQKLVSDTVPTIQIDSFIDSVNKLSIILNCQIIPLLVSTRKTTSTVLSNPKYSNIIYFISINPEITIKNSINYIFEGRPIYEEAELIDYADCVMI